MYLIKLLFTWTFNMWGKNTFLQRSVRCT